MRRYYSGRSGVNIGTSSALLNVLGITKMPIVRYRLRLDKAVELRGIQTLCYYTDDELDNDEQSTLLCESASDVTDQVWMDSLCQGQRFSLQIDSGTHSASYPLGRRGCFPESKWDTLEHKVG
jgi:hypothetical protein